MDQTSSLSLPLILPALAQKHVTYNEALLRLDTVVQLAVISRNRPDAPGTPAEGDRYIVPDGRSWTGGSD